MLFQIQLVVKSRVQEISQISLQAFDERDSQKPFEECLYTCSLIQ